MNLSFEQEMAVKATESKIVVVAAAGSGKALENGSLVYTVTGPKKIENLKNGDKIYGEDGRQHTVRGVFPQGKKKKYIVKFSDKTEIACCSEHLWTFQTASMRGHKSKKWLTKTLQEIMDDYPLFCSTTTSGKVACNKRRNIFIPMIEPINFPKNNLPLDPYTLGALLGDGTMWELGKSDVFSNADTDVIHRVQKGLEAIGCSLLHKHDETRPYDYQIIQNSHPNKIGAYKQILQSLQLLGCRSDDKFIPDVYKYSSVEDRLELLKGLIDTDGYCKQGAYGITLKSKQLILDIQEVCESLGFTATYGEKETTCVTTSPLRNKHRKNCGRAYCLYIKTSKKYPRIHYSQKKEQQYKMPKVFAHRAIEEIIETDEYVDMTCISVDNPTSLFLTNHFIVTHNTKVITERIRYLVNSGVNPNGIFAITFTNNAAQEMKDRLQDLKEINDVFIGTIHSLANRILVRNGIKTQEVIEDQDFNQLFYLIKTSDIKLPPVSHLLIDEFQDITQDFYEFYFRDLKPDNFFAVGDGRQCQPAGTKVRLRDNIYKNIEDIVPGDSVVWYDSSKAYASGPTTKAKNTIEKKVLEVSVRDFTNDDLITISSETGKTSRYTPNHRTFIKLNKTEYKYAVYLMCDDNYRFRIGKIPFYADNKSHKNPWREKMYQEGCSKIWILQVFKSDHEARVLEAKLSYQYNIPQVCWQLDKVSWTQEDIDYIYEGLNTKQSAALCLKEFHRNLDYPLLDKNTEQSLHIHYATNAVTEIYACNLMPEVMSCVVYDESIKTRRRYDKIIKVDYNYITTPIKVYSLRVEGETYVADDIITHNCIYSFSGGSLEWMNRTINDYDTTVYELNTCYRCPSNIMKFANRFICGDPDIYFTETECANLEQGTILTTDFLPSHLVSCIKNVGNYKGWFVLCRTNSQVADTLELLKKAKIPAETFKKSAGTLEDLNAKMNNDTVKVLTIHSAKGLENDNVAVIGGRNFNAEEKRLEYVAATRAKQNLIWYKGGKQRKAYSNNGYNRMAFGN